MPRWAARRSQARSTNFRSFPRLLGGLCCGSDQGPRAEFVPGVFLFGVKRKGDKLESCGSFLMECSRREKTEPEAGKPLAHQRDHGGLEVGWEIAGLKLQEQ